MTCFDAQVTFLPAADLEATARFYEQVLGLPLVLDQGACRIYRVAHRAFVGFCRGTPGPAQDDVVLTLVTDDVDGWHARLVAAGAVVDKAPAPNPAYRIYHCFVRDPSGHRLEIQRFEDPRWPRAD